LTMLEEPSQKGMVCLESSDWHWLGPMKITGISNVVGSHSVAITPRYKVRQMSHCEVLRMFSYFSLGR
jgi:hypothetical protein